MQSHFFVQDNGKFGIPLSAGDGIDSVVEFKGKGPRPNSVVTAQPTQGRAGVPHVAPTAWAYAPEWVRLADVPAPTSARAGEPIPRLDPELLSSEERERFDACARRVGKEYVVRVSEVEDLCSHYGFAAEADERAWLADCIRNGSDPTSFNGKPLRYTADVARSILDALGEEHLVQAVQEKSQNARSELQRLHQEQEQVRKEGQALKKRIADLTAKVERATEEATASEELVKEYQAKADALAEVVSEREARREDLEKLVESLKADHELGRARLQERNKDLEKEHRTLLVRVEEAKRRARLEHDRDDARVPLLRELGELVDERKTLEQAGDRLIRRVAFEDLVGLHVAMKYFPFLVLTGPSGSGKSSLLRMYGDALGMYTEMIPVQPNWTSVADLHGYVFPIGETRHYVTTPFSRALGMQVEEEEFLSLVVLDEINLAHVEYYLADYLSAFEHDRTVDLASPLELEGARAPEWISAARGRVRVPTSFLMAGTANEDHTTRAFSDKFRDRMASLEITPSSKAALGKGEAGLDDEGSVRLGRVTPATWAEWRQPPEKTGRNPGKAFSTANAIIAELEGASIAFGHRQYRDVELFIRAAEPLLGVQGGTTEANAQRACDIALEMRVLQKSAPLLEAVRDRDEGTFHRTIDAIEKKAAQNRKHYPRVLRWVERVRRQH